MVVVIKTWGPIEATAPLFQHLLVGTTTCKKRCGYLWRTLNKELRRSASFGSFSGASRPTIKISKVDFSSGYCLRGNSGGLKFTANPIRDKRKVSRILHSIHLQLGTNELGGAVDERNVLIKPTVEPTVEGMRHVVGAKNSLTYVIGNVFRLNMGKLP